MADTHIDNALSKSQVLVKFTTKSSDIAVPADPILVPTSLKRYGLSGVVNHLLETSKPVPFDFLVDGIFLRTSINDYLASNGLTTESTIEIEYVRSILPPSFVASWEQDDWVSTVHLLCGEGQIKGNERVLSGSYDGIARIYDLSGQILTQAIGHTSSIKSAKWVRPYLSSTFGEQQLFVTASMDRTVRLWSANNTEVDMTGSEPIIANPLIEYIGHKSTVEDVAVNEPKNRILSGGSDQSIALWSLDASESQDAPDIIPTASTRVAKKRKVTKKSPAERKKPLAMITTAHTAPISSVIFDEKDGSVGYSVSWDHTIVTHDLYTAKTVDTRTTQHPLLSITQLPTLSLLAAGSAARHITLHDPRASATTVASSILRGHTNGVVSLVRSPESDYMLASGSHDGTVRVWDVRAVGRGDSNSGGSIYTIKRESGSGKVFSVDWRLEVGLVSGGEDKKVQINRGEGLENSRVM